MSLHSKKTIQALLAKHGAKPSKGLGQNFLVNEAILANILKAANVSKEDTVVEVGPGLGVLTKALAEQAGYVIAIEKDASMVQILKDTLREYNNVEIIHGDALKVTSYELQVTRYKVVANIPYYLTSPLMRKFIESKNQPEQMVLMVQKEVAQRICSKPPRMSLLAVSVQFYAEAKIVAKVPKKYFWPSPKVDSAVISIIPKQEKPSVDADAFFTVVKAGFSQPRKQLANNFSVAFKKDRPNIEAWLFQNNINPKQRAETLTLQDWINLTQTP